MRHRLCYALAMSTIILLLACLVTDNTDSAAPEAPQPLSETHQIVECAPYDHVFLDGHKGLEMVLIDYGDREGVVTATPRLGGKWDFACPDIPGTLHVFWLD